MSLRLTLRLSGESLLEEGLPDEIAAKKRRAHDAKLRPKRQEVARRNPRWHELEEVDLVARGRGWFVSASTDEIFQPARGTIFAPYSIDVVSDMAELWFYVDRDGELHFLERVRNPATTWSEYVARQARRGR